MEGGDRGKIQGIKPMVYRASFRTLWMGSVEVNQSLWNSMEENVSQSWKWQQD